MSDEERLRGETPEEERPTRRRFLKIVGGALAGAYAIAEMGAEAEIIERPAVPALGGPLVRPPLNLRLNEPSGGDERDLPPFDEKRGQMDTPPDFGPLVVMARPAYDPTPPNTHPFLYADRFFENWNEAAPNWFGGGQLGLMKTPGWRWLSTSPLPPAWCAVGTIWNKGREPAYGVILRALCFAVYKAGPNQWEEVCRADLGYVHVGPLTPGDFVEIRYPVSAVRDGMKALDDHLMANDPRCQRFQNLWYFHKCFAFDPVADPLSLKPPLKAPDPPRSVIGGRHGAGWRWEVPPQAAGAVRVRHFG